MKRILAIQFFFLVCATANAANEIHAFAPGMTTVYSVVREADGDVWYVAGQVFEAWGTGGRAAADYDIAMTDKSGDFFVGDFDTNIANGDYIVAVHYQAGVAPSDSDAVIWIQDGTWDGATFAASLDEGAIADEVVAHMDANSTQLAAIVADTGELQTDWHDGGRLDLLIDGIKAMTDLMAVVTTTVAGPNDANNFTITAGQNVNDAYWMNAIMVEDATDSHAEVRWITEYVTSRDVTVDEPFSFTPAAADRVWILGPVYGGMVDTILDSLNVTKVPTYYYTGTRDDGKTTYYDTDGKYP